MGKERRGSWRGSPDLFDFLAYPEEFEPLACRFVVCNYRTLFKLSSSFGTVS